MIAGVPKETFPGERRVALVPGVLPALVKAGISIRIEAGAGSAAGFSDADYTEKGAEIVGSRGEVFEAGTVLQVRGPGANPAGADRDLEALREGQTLIAFCDPLGNPRAAMDVARRGVSLLAMEMIPRIARAQSMDGLSSMATIAGYKAVLMAANLVPRMFPLMMTASGTITPARVFVIGAGVAGLQAIATARRLGAVVTAYDVRPEVKEQVESMGARFAEIPLEGEGASGEGGYAKEMGEEFYRRQRELMASEVAEAHVVVTTAAVPGRKAPVLVTAEMVRRMPPGSVIVDLAAERGGNCELTRPDETVREGDVTILGPTNIPASVPTHASQMYAKNTSNLLLHVAGQVSFEGGLFPPAGLRAAEDPIVKETLVAAGGEVLNPRIREALGLSPAASEAPAPAGGAPGGQR